MLGGCEKEGPAEQAGENIDEAVEEMQEQAEDTTDKAMEKIELEREAALRLAITAGVSAENRQPGTTE